MIFLTFFCVYLDKQKSVAGIFAKEGLLDIRHSCAALQKETVAADVPKYSPEILFKHKSTNLLLNFGIDLIAFF